jgi:hypothetical protein
MLKGDSKEVSTSAELTTAGHRITVFSYAVRHGDTSQSSMLLKNGGTSGTVKWGCSSVAGTNSGDKTDHHTFGGRGLEFPNGCWVALGGTDTIAYIQYYDHDA